MEVLIVFWLVVVNPLVGYLIGKHKNDVREGVILGLLLGPIGWLIAALHPANLRKCPFCSEHIKPDAKVCRYCGRDLPDLPPQPVSIPDPASVPKAKQTHMDTSTRQLVVLSVVVLFVILFILGIRHSKNPRSSFDGVESTPVSSTQVVTITQEISIGADTVPTGTQLELVSREDPVIYVRYGNGVYGILISATDLK